MKQNLYNFDMSDDIEGIVTRVANDLVLRSYLPIILN